MLVYYNATKGKGKTKKPHKFPFTLNLRKWHWLFFSMDIDIFFKSLGLSLFYIAHFLFLKSLKLSKCSCEHVRNGEINFVLKNTCT